MSLEPDAVRRSDFPLVRRGYDPAAVKEHLEAVATSLGRGPAADTVSSQVAAIVSAAEQAAAAIEREARERAGRLSDSAAARAKQEATQRLDDATGRLQAQIKTIETELGTLLTDLRQRVQAIGGAVAELEAGIGEAQDTKLVAEPPEPAIAPEAAAAVSETAGPASDDEAALANARLVALNLALGGESREQIDAHLAREFPQLRERGELLDEVQAVAAG